MEHPITPPPELVAQWRLQWIDCSLNRALNRDHDLQLYIAKQASQWGWDQRGAATEAELQKAADQELEAILEMVGFGQQSLPEEDRYLDGFTVASIRAARRPKPPSLKEQALNTLDEMSNCMRAGFIPKRSDLNTIRQLLEALPND